MKIITAIWIICIVALPMHSMFVNLKLGRSQWIPLLWTGLAVFAGPLIIIPYLFDYFHNAHPRLARSGPAIANQPTTGNPSERTGSTRPPVIVAVKRRKRQ